MTDDGPKRCASCGASLPAGGKVCLACGKTVAPPSPDAFKLETPGAEVAKPPPPAAPPAPSAAPPPPPPPAEEPPEIELPAPPVADAPPAEPEAEPTEPEGPDEPEEDVVQDGATQRMSLADATQAWMEDAPGAAPPAPEPEAPRGSIVKPLVITLVVAALALILILNLT